MPCTVLQKVGALRSSNSCCLCLEKGSMRRQMTLIPCCTVRPMVVTVRWHVTSLQNSSWTHRTGTRCVGCHGTELVSKCKVYTCAWISLCSEACCDKTGVMWTRLGTLFYKRKHLSNYNTTTLCNDTKVGMYLSAKATLFRK